MSRVLLDLSQHARRSPGADARYAGDLLATAVEDYLHVVDERFFPVGGSLAAIASAYAEDHGQTVAIAR